ncbi:GMC family oxidoreductase [Mycobacterium sp. 3519A]|uniref:GMC family oxidoreductase n=1 Tax=Mycobacterium sp. 3519A TaxID=2057184 RepID=UPI00190EAD5F|nr:GMC family oxidoreductase N-terminal domain-containing protein [Mycobacterium sp. 3519A]
MQSPHGVQLKGTVLLSSYDYVIIGGGTGGCVVGGRLAPSGASVLLLEAGPVEPPDVVSSPDAFPLQLMGSQLDWCYRTVPQSGTGDTEHFVSAGRVLGGSSSINAMAHIRGHRANYDRWADYGLTGWSYDDLLPHFKRSETATSGDGDLRGLRGPLRVGPVDSGTDGAPAFHAGVVEAGFPVTADINGHVQVGAFQFDMNIVEGRRQSAADAYLAPQRHRANLDIVGGAFVSRLVIRGDRCVAVEFTVDGRHESVSVEREVILACGAIGSPKVLLLSGIGPAAHLHDVGIEPVVDLPGVGENLQDHIQSRVVYSSSKPMQSSSNGVCRTAALLRSGHFADPAPDVFVMMLDFPVGPVSTETALAPRMPDLGYTLAFSHQAPPASRGSVRLADRHHDTAPLVDPCFYTNTADLVAMAEFLAITRRIGETEAFAPWRLQEVLPGPNVNSASEIHRYLRQSTGSSFHPVGTCRMGTDEMAVVDGELRLHGVQGLRVVDASVMPEIVGVNTNATVVAIAERAAELIQST